MSKSLGNFFTVHDLLDQGIPGEVIRFVFLSTHYRKPMDWTEKKAKEAEKTLRKWYAQAAEALSGRQPELHVVELLADDINTHGVLAECHQYSQAGGVAALRSSMELLGLLGDDVPDWVKAPDVDLSAHETRLFEARQTAMESKDFSEVDRLKTAYMDAGLEVRMSKTGVELVPGPGFDPAKLDEI